MNIPDRFVIHSTDHWMVNHRMDPALPGYLMVGARSEARTLSELPPSALSEVGSLLALVEKTIRETLNPKRIYFGRFGHSEGFGFHIHVIPVYDWVEKLFWQDDRYRVLQQFAAPHLPLDTDGAELTLFIWREFCERLDPPRIEGPSTAEVIARLRNAMLDNQSGLCDD